MTAVTSRQLSHWHLRGHSLARFFVELAKNLPKCRLRLSCTQAVHNVSCRMPLIGLLGVS